MTNRTDAPSAFRMEQAMSVLQSVRARLLNDDPDLAGDEALFHDMLEGEAGGDPFDVLDRVIRASVIAEGMAAEAKARRDAVATRQERYKRRAETLRAAAFAALDALGLKRHERADFLVTIGASKDAVQITDEAALPDAFVKITRAPIKKEIGDALRAGEVIEGATLSNGLPVFTVRTR